MHLWDDRRGQAIQVGAAILLTFVVMAIALYQAQVVPSQNEQVEFNHNQKVQSQLQDLRDAIVSVPGGGTGRSVSIDMGTTYPERTIFLNPPPPSSQIRTTDAGKLRIDNATVAGETGDFWNGSERSVWTRALVYRPNYHVYQSAPTTVYENTFVYDRTRSANLTESDQLLVDGQTITLVALNGSYQAATRRSVSVDLSALSSSGRSVAVENTGGNVTLTVPTTLDESTWRDLLDPEMRANGGTVVGIGYRQRANAQNLLTIELAAGKTYSLRMAKVGIGSSTADTDPAYLTAVRGDGAAVDVGQNHTVVAEVRDRFNNPVTGVVVNASVVSGPGSVTPASDQTGVEGRASFRYSASSSGTATVEVTYSTSPGAAQTVSFRIQVSDGGGGGSAPPYELAWNTTAMADEPDIDSCTATTCVYNRSADPPGNTEFVAHVNTSPSTSLVNVDFATDDAGVITGFTPEAGTTDGDGTITTDVAVGTGGSANVSVASTADSDRLEIVVVGGGGGGSNTAPTADAGGPYAVDEGNSTTLDGSASSDPDGSIQYYDWEIVTDPTGGASIADADNTTATATFDAPSSVASNADVTVRLTVTDNDGATDSATRNVTVRDTANDPPTANFTVVCSGSTCDFDASSSSDPDGSINSYAWEFGDGNVSVGQTVTHTYSASGVYTVNLTVADDEGATDITSKQVAVGKPTLVDAVLPETPIDDREAQNNLQSNLTLVFDRQMNTSVAPNVTLSNVTGASVTKGSGSWVDQRTYELPLTFSDNDVDETVTVNVSGAEDQTGEQMANTTALSFLIDTQTPPRPDTITIDTDPINASNQDNVTVTVYTPGTLQGDEVAVVILRDQSGTPKGAKAPVSGSGKTTISGIDVSSLDDGTIVPTAHLEDDVGNVGPSVTNDSATKDTRSPTFVSVDDDRTAENDSAVQVPISYEDANPDTVTIRLFDGAGNSATFADVDDSSYGGGNTTHNVTISLQNPDATTGDGIRAGTTYDVEVTATDVAGNAGSGTGPGTVEVTTNVSNALTLTPNVKSAGNSGQYSFEVKNEGSKDVTVVAIAVNNTTQSSVAEVGAFSGGDSILSVNGTQVLTSSIPVTPSTPDGTRVDLDSNVQLPDGEVKLFEFVRFLDSNGQQAQMMGEEVYVTLHLSTGQKATLHLVP